MTRGLWPAGLRITAPAGRWLSPTHQPTGSLSLSLCLCLSLFLSLYLSLSLSLPLSLSLSLSLSVSVYFSDRQTGFTGQMALGAPWLFPGPPGRHRVTVTAGRVVTPAPLCPPRTEGRCRFPVGDHFLSSGSIGDEIIRGVLSVVPVLPPPQPGSTGRTSGPWSDLVPSCSLGQAWFRPGSGQGQAWVRPWLGLGLVWVRPELSLGQPGSGSGQAWCQHAPGLTSCWLLVSVTNGSVCLLGETHVALVSPSTKEVPLLLPLGM